MRLGCGWKAVGVQTGAHRNLFRVAKYRRVEHTFARASITLLCVHAGCSTRSTFSVFKKNYRALRASDARQCNPQRTSLDLSRKTHRALWSRLRRAAPDRTPAWPVSHPPPVSRARQNTSYQISKANLSTVCHQSRCALCADARACERRSEPQSPYPTFPCDKRRRASGPCACLHLEDDPPSCTAPRRRPSAQTEMGSSARPQTPPPALPQAGRSPHTKHPESHP
mmetsp:Transcript_15172/g.40709  ORF Transcript_15172/g.40709 Transcript_15172/m.40709 type:complete len:225 (+) Transcript_15172:134-808(+)